MSENKSIAGALAALKIAVMQESGSGALTNRWREVWNRIYAHAVQTEKRTMPIKIKLQSDYDLSPAIAML